MILTLTSGDETTLTGTINAATVGATAAVHIRRSDFTVASHPATSLTDNGDGTSAWSLDLDTGDLTVAGTYSIEVEVTYSDGKPQTFAQNAGNKGTTFEVRSQIA